MSAERALLAVLDLQPWMEDALCAQTDPEVFFPDKGQSAKQAKRVCARCPVQQPCLAYALDRPELQGVWGGLTERERRQLRTARREAA
ncbi:MAG: WhiB family transcriptional regulator [Nocardioidaceae bacterium]